MNVRWPVVAFCVLALFTLRSDGRGRGGFGDGHGGGGGHGGMGGGGGFNGGGPNGGGFNSNSRYSIPTLENAMGEAVWTGGGNNADQASSVYKPLTKDESAKATDVLRASAKAADDKLHMHFKDAVSEHTLVFATATDSALPGLSSKTEQAYTLALRAFGAQSKQVVLPGKLLIYIFDKSSLYESFAKDNDNFEVPKGAVGYTWFSDDGSGAMHIVMGPPPDDLVDRSVKPITAWQAALVRATTFALLNRFHSNQSVPNWVTQGLADVAADSVLPQPAMRTRAYLMSQGKDFKIADVLNDKNNDFTDHPLMQTLTETLLTRDHAAYVSFLVALKDGKKTPDALQSSYKWTFDQLGDAWDVYIKRFSVRTS